MKLEKAIQLGYEIIIWGTGNCFKKNIDKIKKNIAISAFTDSDASYEDKLIKGFQYRKIDRFTQNVFVIILIEKRQIVDEIERKLKDMNIPYCLAEEAIGFCSITEETAFVEEHWTEISKELSLDDSQWNNVLKKYINLNVPATTCNLQCPYCYIRRSREFNNPPQLYHHPKYIRFCLSQKRLNGQALITLCAAGETMLADKFVDVCVELLQEGHFLHIVTNGTLTNKINELIERAGKYKERLFFKFSFHYGEFKRRKQLEIFANNVNCVSKAGASFTVELTTDDDLIDLLEEIKEFSMKHFGAWPHITIARDDTQKDIPIYTQLSSDKYFEIWSQFNSKQFEVKWNYFGKFIDNCYAGKSTLNINLRTGDVSKCLGQPRVGNIYMREFQLLEYEAVKNQCVFPYCYNNHAYLTLGASPDVKTYSYAEIRDRERLDGTNWLSDEVYNFINQKLYETNVYQDKEG